MNIKTSQAQADPIKEEKEENYRSRLSNFVQNLHQRKTHTKPKINLPAEPGLPSERHRTQNEWKPNRVKMIAKTSPSFQLIAEWNVEHRHIQLQQRSSATMDTWCQQCNIVIQISAIPTTMNYHPSKYLL